MDEARSKTACACCAIEPQSSGLDQRPRTSEAIPYRTGVRAPPDAARQTACAPTTMDTIMHLRRGIRALGRVIWRRTHQL
jgi:hypothetical protein